MTATERGGRMEDPEGPLEQALIEEFLQARGFDRQALDMLLPNEAKRLLTQASIYAAAKLAEVEARAHFVEEIHGEK